jgi:hypothetical protein
LSVFSDRLGTLWGELKQAEFARKVGIAQLGVLGTATKNAKVFGGSSPRSHEEHEEGKNIKNLCASVPSWRNNLFFMKFHGSWLHFGVGCSALGVRRSQNSGVTAVRTSRRLSLPALRTWGKTPKSQILNTTVTSYLLPTTYYFTSPVRAKSYRARCGAFRDSRACSAGRGSLCDASRCARSVRRRARGCAAPACRP